MFGFLGQIGLPKVDIKLVDRLTSITPNRWFRVCDQDGLPPEHGNVREVGSRIQHSLAGSHKLAGSAVKGHDAADDEGA